MRRYRIGLLWVLLMAAVTAGCGTSGGGGGEPNSIGDIPDDQVFVLYAPPQGGYNVKIPEGWTSTQRADGAVSFTDKLNTILLESKAAAAAPDETTARAGLAAIKTSPGYAEGAVSTVARPAGPAVLATYRIDAPADAVTGKIINDDVERYQFFHAGLLVTVTLSGPHGADNVDPWRTVTDSLAWAP
ncbi:hypothetical protein F4553_000893 [Allocatelliglobosispora scoriae]|uniref:Lipoprotein n=1 Tax=Allocatelliglobosispora scoriae TaxID=643052 RepID=A0A841BGV9_9ACTN|nr:hypothetical protein [Allocatelliglobosispora scoriae]MBB5867514.1 hypothetical protein [Allocatelliglobosispora scoriae]